MIGIAGPIQRERQIGINGQRRIVKEGQARGGNIAEVLSVLFPQAALHNVLLDAFWWDMQTAHNVGAVALEQLLADTSAAEWAYSGSLTSPPCTEGVRWHVRVSNTGVNVLQLLSFEYAIGGTQNTRPLQRLAGRSVELRRWR